MKVGKGYDSYRKLKVKVTIYVHLTLSSRDRWGKAMTPDPSETKGQVCPYVYWYLEPRSHVIGCVSFFLFFFNVSHVLLVKYTSFIFQKVSGRNLILTLFKQKNYNDVCVELHGTVLGYRLMFLGYLFRNYK